MSTDYYMIFNKRRQTLIQERQEAPEDMVKSYSTEDQNKLKLKLNMILQDQVNRRYSQEDMPKHQKHELKLEFIFSSAKDSK